MRVLGISGSLRADSHNTRLLRRVAEHLPGEAGFEIFEDLGRVPPYSEDVQARGHDSVEALRRAILGADAVVFATPEYNASIPGQLKNALDWVSRPRTESPFQNKTVIVLSASTGQFGGVWAQAELRKVLASMGARVIETDFALDNASQAWHSSGRLTEAAREERLAAAIQALVEQLEPSLVAA